MNCAKEGKGVTGRESDSKEEGEGGRKREGEKEVEGGRRRKKDQFSDPSANPAINPRMIFRTLN